MLVSPWIGTLFLYVSLFIAGAGFIAVKVQRSEPPPTTLPDAVVVGGRARRLRRSLPWWLPVLPILGGLVGALWLYQNTFDVYVVTEGDAGPEVDHMVHLGGTSYAPLAPADDGSGRDDGWVVNRSTHTVRVEEAVYGSIGIGGGPRNVPAGTALRVRRIDYVGPNHPPPQSIESDSALHMDWRYWLTW